MFKHAQTICRQIADKLLSVFDHFVGLALKALTHFRPLFFLYRPRKKNRKYLVLIISGDVKREHWPIKENVV